MGNDENGNLTSAERLRAAILVFKEACEHEGDAAIDLLDALSCGADLRLVERASLALEDAIERKMRLLKFIRDMRDFAGTPERLD